jgi:hypothetical protein
MVKNSKNIFISFKNTNPNNSLLETKDTELASILTDILQKEGFTVFFFKHHVTPGASIDEKLNKVINKSFYFIWISTSPLHLTTSRTVINEIYTFEKNRLKNPKLVFIPFLDKNFTVDNYKTEGSELDTIKDLEVVSFDTTSYKNEDFLSKAKIVVNTIKNHDKKINPATKKILETSKPEDNSSLPELDTDLEMKVKDYESNQELIQKYISQLKDKVTLTPKQYENLPVFITNQINTLKDLLKEIPNLYLRFPTIIKLESLKRLLVDSNIALKDFKKSQYSSFKGFSLFSIKMAYNVAIKKIKKSGKEVNDDDINKTRIDYIANEHTDKNRRKARTNENIVLKEQTNIIYRLLSNTFFLKKVSIDIKNEYFEL